MDSVALLAQQSATAQKGLTVAGGLIMFCAVGFVLGLLTFCMAHVLRKRDTSPDHFTLDDLKTPDGGNDLRRG